ncbi:MAG: hypothetical protein HOQ24_01465 [Mycobacteriaceae bacterium]|nr:hypothetical protein [Mycobacteriaceae bacterium]
MHDGDHRRRQRYRRATTAILAVAVAVSLTGCGCGKKRWCEHDATDTKVSDSYCKRGAPGYEWETDSHHKKGRHKH